MSLNQNDLLQYLNQQMNPQFFEDYAPNGLQIEGSSQITRLAFAVSATQDSIKKAIDWGAQGLVVHHGIFWKYQGARTVTGAWGERVKACVKNDLNLFAYHLPLDAHAEFGNAVALGIQLGLTQLAPFALYKKQPMGSKGTLAQPMTAKELKLKLEQVLNHSVILASPDENKIIKTMGIITGGANNDWVKAMEEGLDAYLTGEISEYNWHDAKEAGIHFFAGGHHATERFGILALMEKVKKNYSNIDVEFFDSLNPA
ncbi:MAG: Nif3-like dinuclear metal center hexameric protein [Bdellovibrionales bacterium]|nr:Nif3-like dinuclear metal center hexameric protein [Bdellovibrionales bacterium]